MTKVVVAMLEGQHDVAFVTRVLLVNGFKVNNKKISHLEAPFKQMFTTLLSDESLEDRKFGYHAPTPFVPSVGLAKEDTLVFLHDMKGDGKARERKQLFEQYSDLFDTGDEEDFLSEYSLSFRFVIGFDADDVGVDDRISQIASEITIWTECDCQSESLSGGQVYQGEKCEFGAYIFHDATSQNEDEHNAIENQLLKLIEDLEGSKELLKSVTEFLETHQLEQERQKAYIKCTDSDRAYRGQPKFKVEKAKIGLLCQLQFSGQNNAAFIRESDFLRFETLFNNKQCQQLARLFE